MAKVSYVDVDPGTEDLFFSNLNPGDRFGYSNLRRTPSLFSKQKIKGLTQKSLLPQVAALWNEFVDTSPSIYGLSIFGNHLFGDETENNSKNLWTQAAAECGLNGWRLFVQDTCLRIKNSLSGVATPSLLHQAMVGYLYVASPATEIKIGQYHPRSYWTSHKVYGKKGMHEPVLITEDFSLPLVLTLNYKSDLTSQGAGSFAKFFATVRSSYQGIDRFADCEILLDLSSDWKTATATLTNVLGYVIGYTAYFHLYNLRGTLWCDNIKIEHSGQNWCRDPFCKDLNQGFTRAFYQIPKHWVSVEMPSGAEFGSIYPS